MSDARYAIGELADLGGISRRTVRYYVQEGLLPAPLGVGRGDHYGREHLDRLLQVKALQEAGGTLEEIRLALAGGPAPEAARVREETHPLPPTMWRRLELLPGVELHVSGDVRLPPPGRLRELAAWCRTYFGNENE